MFFPMIGLRAFLTAFLPTFFFFSLSHPEPQHNGSRRHYISFPVQGKRLAILFYDDIHARQGSKIQEITGDRNKNGVCESKNISPLSTSSNCTRTKRCWELRKFAVFFCFLLVAVDEYRLGRKGCQYSREYAHTFLAFAETETIVGRELFRYL